MKKLILFFLIIYLPTVTCQRTLGNAKDESAPLISSEYTTFNPGSGWCRFIPDQEYTIKISSGCSGSFDLYLPDFMDCLTVSCEGEVNIQFGYNQTHYVYFQNVENDVLYIRSNGPLPVELVSFSATCSHGAAKLKWNTACEINCSRFDIERQLSGESNWQKIGSVQAAGNSNSPHEYSYTDIAPASGKYLYRLKIIDNDGSTELSKYAAVDIVNFIGCSLSQNYPNPFNPGTLITYHVLKEAQVSLDVFDVLGTRVQSLVNEVKLPGEYSIQFDGSRLASGVYFYTFRSVDYTQTRKMIISK